MSLTGLIQRTLHFKKSNGLLFLRMHSSLLGHHSKCFSTVMIEGKAKRKPPLYLLSTRNFSEKQQKSSVADSEKIDIGPGTWKEIYHGILTTQIRMVKLFSLSTSGLGLMVQPVLIQHLGEHMGLAVVMGAFVGFFTFATPLMIHWITKKYVTRIEYDPERDIYSATTISFFLREKKVDFNISDVKVPDVPGIFTTFHVKNRALFVDPSMFGEIEHFGRIMGYDKPMDFKIHEDEDKS